MSFLDFLGTPGGGAIAQGAANLFGGLFRGSDPESATRNQKWQFRRQRDMFKWQTDWAKEATGHTMRDVFRTADQSGIHRLAALGGASAYQPTGMSVGGPGPTEQQPFLGDSMSEALNTFIRGKEFQHQQKMDEAELELIKAQAKTLEAQARRTETGTQAISTATADQTPSGTPTIDANPVDPLSYYNRTGPYAGHFVIPMGDGYYKLPKGTTPSEVAEAITGSVTGEVHGIIKTLGAQRIKRPKLASRKPTHKGKPGETVRHNEEYVWYQTKGGPWVLRKRGIHKP